MKLCLWAAWGTPSIIWVGTKPQRALHKDQPLCTSINYYRALPKVSGRSSVQGEGKVAALQKLHIACCGYCTITSLFRQSIGATPTIKATFRRYDQHFYLFQPHYLTLAALSHFMVALWLLALPADTMTYRAIFLENLDFSSFFVPGMLNPS
jgi:hypothetical protein